MNNCFECENCIYVGEGDYFCDNIMEFVIEDWLPSEYFGGCKNEIHTD